MKKIEIIQTAHKIFDVISRDDECGFFNGELIAEHVMGFELPNLVRKIVSYCQKNYNEEEVVFTTCH